MNTVITVLLCMLLYSFGFAQQKLFGSKISGNADIISDAILIQDGYVLDSAIVNILSFVNDNNAKKYRFEYYEDGKLKRNINSKGWMVQELVNGRSVIKYFPGGNEYFYNEKGYIDSTNFIYWSDSTWVYVYSVHYSYDNKRNLLSKIFSNSEGIWRTEENSYDSLGNPILSTEVIVNIDDTTKTIRDYDLQNRLTKVITRTGSYPHYSIDQKLFEYDSLGNINCLVPSIYYISQSTELDTIYKYLNYYFEFDGSEKLQSETLTQFSDLDSTRLIIYKGLLNYNDSGKIQDIYNYQFFHYDSDGNLDTMKLTHNNGYLINKATLIDSYGNKITFPDYIGFNIFYYRKLLTDVKKPNEINKPFILSQNYPNPFNPSTTISFSIPKTSLVKLIIYDALGRKIKTLLNEVKASGIHKIEFNAEEFSSGVYFYSIQAGSFTETKKFNFNEIVPNPRLKATAISHSAILGF